jgi:hypothetical protein
VFTRLTLLACLILTMGVLANGQDSHYTYPFALKCPEVALGGEAIEISTKFEGGHTGERYRPTYNWSVTAGTIESGQGTPAVKIALEKTLSQVITVTMTRNFSEGHYPMVQREANCSIAVMPAPVAMMTDEFVTRGGNCEEGFARLDGFFNELNNNPNSEGLIVFYNDSVDKRAAARRELQLRNHFIFRKFPRDRVTFVRGVPREKGTTQFWLVPPGADHPEIDRQVVLPEASPTVTYLYAAFYLEGVPGCSGHIYDLGEYANELKSLPGSRGRIVISDSSRGSFNEALADIASELAAAGIPRNRYTAVYKYVRPNRLLQSIELWVIPGKTK